MKDAVQVLVLGTGQMGSGIARTIIEKQGLELAGAYCQRAERDGLDIGEFTGIGVPKGIKLKSDLNAAIDFARPDVAIQASCSTLHEARSEILTLLDRGISVVTIAEEMAYPACAPRDIRCPQVGSITMDQTLIDVTGLCGQVAIGDEVVLIGQQNSENLEADELATKLGTISYNVVAGNSARVPRVAVNRSKG